MPGAQSVENGKKGGRPKMTSTLVAQQMREQLVVMVNEQFGPVTDAQLRLAKGITVMMTRNKIKQKDGSYKREGQWYQVSDANEVAKLLNEDDEDGENFYQIVTKDPNPKAYAYLSDQALGKAKESIDVNANIMFVIDE